MLSPADIGLPPKFSAFAPGQERAILHLATSEYRFSIFDGPTGSGKSIIYYSAPRLLGLRTLILVPTKALQSQLETDFSSSGLYSISGHSSYPCSSASYEDGELSDLECGARRAGQECHYYTAVDRALQSSAVVTNPAHWVQLAKSEDPDRLGKFDFLVCDEAHLMQDLLVGYMAVKLNAQTYYDLLEISLIVHGSSIEDWRNWSRTARTLAETELSRLGIDKGSERLRAKLRRIISDLTRFLTSSTSTPWVCEPNPKGCTLTPVWGEDFAEDYLFRGIPRIALCSATITPQTVAHLGVLEPNYDFYEMPSTFSAARRPVWYVPTTPRIPVDSKITEGGKRVWVNRIDSIISGRLDRKGIIHSRSYGRALDIIRYSKHSGIMLHHTSSTTRDTVARFKRAKPPCILVSPAVEEGFDFPGDECRYVIIAKVPFLDTRDPLIKARADLDPEYAKTVTAQTIMQMAGRGMRSARDTCEIFITDAHWQWFRKNTKLFTKWFRDSWHSGPIVPKALALD